MLKKRNKKNTKESTLLSKRSVDKKWVYIKCTNINDNTLLGSY